MSRFPTSSQTFPCLSHCCGPGALCPPAGAVGRRAHPARGRAGPQSLGGGRRGSANMKKKNKSTARRFTQRHSLLPADPHFHHSCSAEAGDAEPPEGLQDTSVEGCFPFPMNSQSPSTLPEGSRSPVDLGMLCGQLLHQLHP